MSSIFGGSSSQSSQNSQYTSNPLNLQLDPYTGLAPGVAGGFGGIYGSQGNPGAAFGLNPFMAGGQSTQGANPLTAPMTPQQTALLQQIFGSGQGNPILDSASSNIKRFSDPTYAAQLAQGPQTQAAITAATNPIINAFKQTTMPGLEGQFTGSGQRISTPQGGGSSAFAKAGATAQGNLEANVGQVAGGIANQAYQTGLAENAASVGQAMQFSQTQLKNLTDSLQAVALPQMIQQFGINAGVQLFQQQMDSILKALGAAGQISQPAIAYQSQGSGFGSSSGSSTPGLLGAAGNIGLGIFGATKASG